MLKEQAIHDTASVHLSCSISAALLHSRAPAWKDCLVPVPWSCHGTLHTPPSPPFPMGITNKLLFSWSITPHVRPLLFLPGRKTALVLSLAPYATFKVALILLFCNCLSEELFPPQNINPLRARTVC